MTRALCGLAFIVALMLCGFTSTVDAPLPDTATLAMANEPASQAAPVAKAPAPRNSVRMKVTAKVYGYAYAPASATGPIVIPTVPAVSSDTEAANPSHPTPGAALDNTPQASGSVSFDKARREVSRLAAKSMTHRLVRLAERCVTGRGEPVPYMV